MARWIIRNFNHAENHHLRFWWSLFLPVLAGVLVILACRLPTLDNESPSGVKPRQLMVVGAPGSTPTVTPFQPSQPTPSPITEATQSASQPSPEASAAKMTTGQSKTWQDYPGPVAWPDIQIPPPVGILPQPDGQVNILLLGSDQRPYESGLRTDTIILLTLNPAAGSANLTSFPRDLYVYIPGWTVQRINTAFGYGGFETLAMTMEYNFGVRPDYYVLINFWSFVEVIDSLGGIDVQIGQALCDHRDNYGTYCVQAGTQHMHGETTLWYVRSRYSTNDLDRNRRQQEVIMALFARLISLDGLARASELYNIYQDNVVTDLKFEQIAAFAPLAVQLADTSHIQHYFIGASEVYDWVNYAGAQVLVPVREAVVGVMRQALNSNQ